MFRNLHAEKEKRSEGNMIRSNDDDDDEAHHTLKPHGMATEISVVSREH